MVNEMGIVCDSVCGDGDVKILQYRWADGTNVARVTICILASYVIKEKHSNVIAADTFISTG